MIQLYPNACAASLLRKFFLVFKSWRWPNPVILAKPHDAGYGLTVWTAGATQDARLHNVAPMITPAYPAMNSSASVSRQTLQILIEEFSRAHDIMDKAWKNHVASGGGGGGGMDLYRNPTADEMFASLFEPSDFFISYPYYLSLCIVGPTETDAQTWSGFVESRLRKLVSDFLGRYLPLSKIQLWPKKLDACVADQTALLSLAQRKNSITYFIGFQVDRLRMKGTALNLEQQVQKFSQFELSKFHAPLVTGVDLLAKIFMVKTLPKICFDGIYEGGKITAMKKRRMMRDSDPARVMAKNNAKLATIKARMEEMNKKKSLLLATTPAESDETRATIKRKRSVDEDEDDEESNPKVKLEEDQVLLDHALDVIQGDTVQGMTKSKEEAEQDRQKLLSGELFMQGGEADYVESNRIEDNDDDDDDEPGYGPEGARKLVNDSQSNDEDENNIISIAEREAEVLRRSGYHVISDNVVLVGGNLILPWRQPVRTMPTLINSVTTKKEETAEVRESSSSSSPFPQMTTVQIKLRTKFDVVELDVNGKVVDIGDDDYMPSLYWAGRRPGFEFKLGDRGIGYYRTGRPVVIPSNLAY